MEGAWGWSRYSSLLTRRQFAGSRVTRFLDSNIGVIESIEMLRLSFSRSSRGKSCSRRELRHGSSENTPRSASPSSNDFNLSYETSLRNWSVYLMDVPRREWGGLAL